VALVDKVTELRIAHEYKSGFNAGLSRAQKMLLEFAVNLGGKGHRKPLVKDSRGAEDVVRQSYIAKLERLRHKNIGAYDPEDDGYLPVVEVPEPTVWCDIHKQVHMRAHVDYMRANVTLRCGEEDWRKLWMMALED
jgi:hypothetical protein